MKIMKTRLLFISTLIVLCTACSKKNWICKCTYDSDGAVFEVSNYNLTTSDAESSCDSRDNLPEITCILEEDN